MASDGDGGRWRGPLGSDRTVQLVSSPDRTARRLTDDVARSSSPASGAEFVEQEMLRGALCVLSCTEHACVATAEEDLGRPARQADTDL